MERREAERMEHRHRPVRPPLQRKVGRLAPATPWEAAQAQVQVRFGTMRKTVPAMAP